MKRLLFILSLLVVVTGLQACDPPSDIIINDREEFFEEGATTIDLSCCKAKRLINIDSEDEGVFTAGCATDCSRLSADPIISRI